LERLSGALHAATSRMLGDQRSGSPTSWSYRLERPIELDRPLSELVKLPVSRINGCAFRIAMH
jgi:alkylhydroperoxidase family enzyme